MSVIIEVGGSAVSAPYLSPCEKTCLLMIAEGQTLAEIGLALDLRESEVDSVLSAAGEKLGAHSRLHAISLAMLKGHLDYENAKPD